MRILIFTLLLGIHSFAFANIEIIVGPIPESKNGTSSLYFKHFKPFDIELFDGPPTQILSGFSNLAMVWEQPKRIINISELPSDSINDVRRLFELEAESIENIRDFLLKGSLLEGYDLDLKIDVYVDSASSLLKVIGFRKGSINDTLIDVFYADVQKMEGLNVSYLHKKE